MSTDLVSIIIPCYNQGKFLSECLSSVLNQTYSNWECIVVNDGCTDNSGLVAKQWVERDSRFKYFYKENSGVSAARNLALDKAKGDFIQFLDADDYIDKCKLELSINEINSLENKESIIVFTNFRRFINNPESTSEPYCILKQDLFTFNKLLYEWNESFSIPIHTALIEASLFKTIRFPEHLTAQEDWLVWVKIFKLNANALFLDKPLALYRFNPESRINSRGIFEDQIIVYDEFRKILSEEEFYKLSRVLIERYFKTQRDYKRRFNRIKKSNLYQTGLMIKKALKTIGLLKLAKTFFPFFLKFKS